MKRYIILSAMLVFALSLSAQSTEQGRATRERSTSGNAIKETRKPEEPKKAVVTKEKTEERKVSRSTTPATATQKSVTRTTTRARTSEPVNPPANRKSTPSVTPERTRETTVTRTREVKPGNTGREITTNQGRTSREVERPAERTISRENSGQSNRTVSTGRTATTRPEANTTDNRVYVPRDQQETNASRRAYSTPERRVVVRSAANPSYVHRTIEYRRTYYPYRVPSRVDIIWDVHLYNQYRYLYPHYNYWYYPVGYRVHTISAYDADRYIGEFARIYGRVYETWFNRETDEVYLYFGEPYPYQDFTVILTGRDARRYSRRPDRYFTGRDIAVTGIVSVFEGKPEMVIKRRSQIDFYF